MRRFVAVLAVLIVMVPLCPAVPALALSNAEYRELMREPEFAEADEELNRVWARAKRYLPKANFEVLRKEQRAWIARGRDAAARELMKRGSSWVEAYTEATYSRAAEISGRVEAFRGH